MLILYKHHHIRHDGLGGLMMLGIKYLAQYFGATEHQTDILLVMVVYATIGSLILSSVLQTILAVIQR